MKNNNRKIIIDCDPGHDDVMAIITAITGEFDILGITTVAGNNTVDNVTNNILNVLDYLNIDIPVYKGASRPLVKEPEPQPLAHGENGLGGPTFSSRNNKEKDIDALSFLKETLEKEDKVTIVALAPLTNIALLLNEYPNLKEKIECIALMGGSIYSGNIQKRSEFNIYHDPEAAKIVFDSGLNIVMAPLEVCYAGKIYLSEYKALANGGRVSKLVFELMEFYCQYAVNRGWDSTAIFDLVPVVYLMHPEYFKGKYMDVSIELNGEYCRGMTICDENKNSKTLVLEDCDRDNFIKELFKAIEILDNKYEQGESL